MGGKQIQNSREGIEDILKFFDPRFSGHPEYFEKLQVWQDERARSCFGTIPVLMTSFGSCKGRNYQQAVKGLTFPMYTMYELHSELQKSPRLGPEDIDNYKNTKQALFDGDTKKIETAIPALCALLYKHYGVMPYILLDEYDTPLLEAYTDGYWDEMISTCRQLFHGAFTENEFYSRAIITGVTSSNKLIGEIIRRHPIRSKYEIEQLMSGAVVHKKINENITFQYLDGDEDCIEPGERTGQIRHCHVSEAAESGCIYHGI